MGKLFERVDIKNFKSIDEVLISLNRVNVLIGRPETGKSNILEAFGLLSPRLYSIKS